MAELFKRRTPYSKIDWNAYPHRVYPKRTSAKKSSGFSLFVFSFLAINLCFFILNIFLDESLKTTIDSALGLICGAFAVFMIYRLRYYPDHLNFLAKQRIPVAATGPEGILIGFSSFRCMFNLRAKPRYITIPFTDCDSIHFARQQFMYPPCILVDSDLLPDTLNTVYILLIDRKASSEKFMYAFTGQGRGVLETGIQSYRPNLLSDATIASKRIQKTINVINQKTQFNRRFLDIKYFWIPGIAFTVMFLIVGYYVFLKPFTPSTQKATYYMRSSGSASDPIEIPRQKQKSHAP